MTIVAAPVTAAELEQMDGRWQLVEGELQTMAPTGFTRGMSTGRIAFRISAHVFAAGLGEVLGAETGFSWVRNRTRFSPPTWPSCVKSASRPTPVHTLSSTLRRT